MFIVSNILPYAPELYSFSWCWCGTVPNSLMITPSNRRWQPLPRQQTDHPARAIARHETEVQTMTLVTGLDGGGGGGELAAGTMAGCGLEGNERLGGEERSTGVRGMEGMEEDEDGGMSGDDWECG
mmetsp:Transcript_24755/g.34117  ORF Transcript_24755/g.34117 Transcript_24755/m.34117 type:complete len:126 (+) Transcript_24755:3-380(+)